MRVSLIHGACCGLPNCEDKWATRKAFGWACASSPFISWYYCPVQKLGSKRELSRGTKFKTGLKENCSVSFLTGRPCLLQIYPRYSCLFKATGRFQLMWFHFLNELDKKCLQTAKASWVTNECLCPHSSVCSMPRRDITLYPCFKDCILTCLKSCFWDHGTNCSLPKIVLQ